MASTVPWKTFLAAQRDAKEAFDEIDTSWHLSGRVGSSDARICYADAPQQTSRRPGSHAEQRPQLLQPARVVSPARCESGRTRALLGRRHARRDGDPSRASLELSRPV